jgi:hypothetical protein
MSQAWHHSRACRFLGSARWCVDRVGLVLLKVIVDRLLPAEAPVLIGIDDTLFRRSGPKVHAAAWHHDGAAKAPGQLGRLGLLLGDRRRHRLAAIPGPAGVSAGRVRVMGPRSPHEHQSRTGKNKSKR